MTVSTFSRKHLLEVIKHKQLMSGKHDKVCRDLNYFEYFLIFIYAESRSVLISAFASLVVVPVGIASFAAGLKIFELTAGIKKYT